MGLTHHWRRATQLDANAFKAAAGDLKRLFGRVSPALAGPDGAGEPIITPHRIAFNGARPLSCEPFEISAIEHDRHGRPDVFSFCKTEGLPYDLHVRMALIVLKHHLGEALRVGSDDKTGWGEAKQLMMANLNYGSDFALTEE